MALSIAAASLIGSGLNLGGNIWQGISQNKMNRESREFQERMWNMTNEYNKAINQRKRLEEAGLNPALMYGGSVSGAAGTADMAGKPDFNVPEWSGVGSAAAEGVNSYYANRSITSGIDVNEARADNIRQDTTNKGIESVLKSINASSSALDYKTKKRLFETTVKTAQQQLQNLGIQGRYTSNKDAREAQVTEQTVAKLSEEINNLRKQGKNLSEENIMRAIDRQMYEDFKIRPQDPIYYRVFGQIMNYLKDEFKP